jgi:hypothetical protein
LRRMMIPLALAIALTLAAPVLAAENYTPSVYLDNYWTALGSPELNASLAGINEFERGDTVDLYVEITNYGRIIGFDPDEKAEDLKEQTLTALEQGYEQEKTTALGITGTVRSTSDLIEVKSGSQVIEALKSGEKSESPMRFTIKIANDAPAGEYPMMLDLTYDYQHNVEVGAKELDPNVGLRGLQIAYQYETANKTVTIPVMVKLEVDFEITDVKAELLAGEKDGIVEVTYKNMGVETADDAIARINVFNPFSTTDDQAYIGTLMPGEERTVTFKIDVNSDATATSYSINSKIKYTDIRGDTVISESMKIPVDVVAAKRSYVLPAVVVLILLLAGFVVYRRRRP